MGAVIGGVVAGGINYSIQYAQTGDVQWNGIGGVWDAAGDGATIGLVLGVVGGWEGGAVAGTASAAERSVMIGEVNVSTSSTTAARNSLEKAGFPGRATTNKSGTEAGTIHNMPGKKMDVRVMDGGPKHPPRIVTNIQGSSQGANPATGKNLGNIGKAAEKAKTHFNIGE